MLRTRFDMQLKSLVMGNPKFCGYLILRFRLFAKIRCARIISVLQYTTNRSKWSMDLQQQQCHVNVNLTASLYQ